MRLPSLRRVAVSALAVLASSLSALPSEANPGLAQVGAGRAALARPHAAPPRIQAGDVFTSVGPSEFQRQAFGYGTLIGHGVTAPRGFGYGGYGYGYGGYPFPLAAGLVDSFGVPLDAARPDPWGGSYHRTVAVPAMTGIPASPVKPPAVYIIGGERGSARPSARRVETGTRAAENGTAGGPLIIEIRPGRS